MSGWAVLDPSPDGRWLLLEQDLYSCGTASTAKLVRSSGGTPIPAIPRTRRSYALGWLPDNTALVAAQSRGCDPPPPAAIYQVRPGGRPSAELVIATDAQDATAWS